MCQHHAPEETPRRGARLEDGADHAADHLAWSRRDFLVRMGLGTVGATFLAGATPIGVFGQAPALDLLAGLDTDRVLVLIQLSGGNDGLNTVVPIANDVYYARRPTIGIARTSALALSDTVGLHPALAAIRPMWDDGRLSVAHAVGYRSQSRSHFEGIDNWFTGSGSALGSTGADTIRQGDGWIGRFLLDALDPDQTAQYYRENPPAVSLGSAQRLFDTGDGNLGIGRLSYTTTTNDLLRRGAVFPTDGLPLDEPFGAPLKYLREQVNVSLAYVVRFVDATSKAPTYGMYPATGLANNLKLAAQIVRGGLSPRIISVTLGGFDTHANQGPGTGTHANLLKQLADALRAFFDDLKVDGLDERVVAMTFSEFGRTLGQNGSAGTDHGAAAPVLLAGPAVEGGFVGTLPNLVTDLSGSGASAAPAPTTDYRSLYATLLERWFRVPPADVDTLLGRRFDRLPFLSATATDAGDAPSADGATALLAPSPNPFSTRATVRYRLATAGTARVSVYDALGRHVATLADGAHPAGAHEAVLDAARLPAGLYLVRLDTPKGSVTRQAVCVR